MKLNHLLFTSLTIFCLSSCQTKKTKISPQTVVGKQGFDLAIVDLDQEKQMQTIVDQEEGQYLGHPSTVLLDDGKTIFCAYPKGHGRGPIVLKKSTDGGQTWSKRLATPKNWATSKEVPTLYQTTDASGKKRLIIFSGSQDWVKGSIRMAVSEDMGETWSPLKSIGDFKGIVAMSDCIALKTPGHYIATSHIRGPKNSMILFLLRSKDGGLTWSKPEEIFAGSNIHLCEAGLVYSPDKAEIAMLLRENSRNYNSQIMFSKDEGKTWTAPRPLPGSLCGDRHQAIYLDDQRLLIQFRDVTPKKRPGNKISPTEGDWAGWVGTWDDLRNGYEGEYRIRFKDNTHGWDSTYPAIEKLADGTISNITYGYWQGGKSPYILSVRFKIAELDAMAEKIRLEGQPPVHNIIYDKVHIFNPSQKANKK